MSDTPSGPPSGAQRLPKLTPVGVKEPAQISGDITLEDGTVLGLRVIIVGASRIEGVKDAVGRPIYNLDSAQIVWVKGTP